jgi:flagellar hook-length control protein FliK
MSSATTSTAAETIRSEAGVLRADPSAAMTALPAQLARQVLHSHAQNLSELRLQLKPEELGSIDLKLRVDGDRVHVAMVTAQPGVRELLETQLPQLRQMLEQGGLQLGDVDVTQRDANTPDEQRPHNSVDADDRQAQPGNDALSGRGERPRSPHGLIDAFV